MNKLIISYLIKLDYIIHDYVNNELGIKQTSLNIKYYLHNQPSFYIPMTICCPCVISQTINPIYTIDKDNLTISFEATNLKVTTKLSVDRIKLIK